MSPKFMAFVLSEVEGVDHKTACGHGDKGGENDSRRYVKGGILHRVQGALPQWWRG